jgi:hypothetical protein
MSNGPTLSVGNFTIETVDGGFAIFAIDDFEERSWIATAQDPETAMKIVEGLILVDMKRFYHPDSTPIMKSAGADKNPLPPFLKKGG